LSAAAVEAGPGWVTLTTPQKLALYPLSERWALLSEAQKRRWLTLAANFASLPAEEQAKFHERMTDWASLSAQQRNQARLNYAVTNRLAPDDKRAQWEAYQALSEEERMALAARGAPKPKGAATALRPVSPKKLAQVPAATEANPASPPRCRTLGHRRRQRFSRPRLPRWKQRRCRCRWQCRPPCPRWAQGRQKQLHPLPLRPSHPIIPVFTPNNRAACRPGMPAESG
jgi:hypothetical protein